MQKFAWLSAHACGQTYIGRIGTGNPADPSAFTMAQVNQCGIDVQSGDCSVMPQIWPASCTAQTQAAPPADPNAAPQCPDGTVWDGTQCSAPPAADPNAGAAAGAACGAGTVWDDNAQQCVAAQAPRRPSGERCRSALIKKGYAPDQLGNCEGVSDRCAVALIAKGYAPDQLTSCRGVDGRCAEQVIAKGYAPDQLINCRR